MWLLTLGRDIEVLKTYGAAPYAAALKKLEKQISEKEQSVNEKIGVKVFYFLQILPFDGLYLTHLGI